MAIETSGTWIVARLVTHGAIALADQPPALGPDQGHEVGIEIVV
jgi:hypothetical protein